MKGGKLAVNFIKVFVTRGDKKRLKKLNVALDYETKYGINYLADNNDLHCLDVLYAKEVNRKNVCVIDIHGGSYIFGHRRNNRIFAKTFLDNGYDVILLDYVPNDGKHGVEDLLNDCANGIKYIASHKDELKIKDDIFVITGDSAGGHIALLLAIANDSKELQKELNIDLGDISFESVLVNSPVYDYTTVGINDLLNKRGVKRMFGPRYFNEPEYRTKYSCSSYIDKLKTPIFISTCKNDFLRLQSLMLYKDIQFNKNVYFDFVDINSDKKEISHVHNVTYPNYEESIQVNNAMIKFIEKSTKK